MTFLNEKIRKVRLNITCFFCLISLLSPLTAVGEIRLYPSSEAKPYLNLIAKIKEALPGEMINVIDPDTGNGSTDVSSKPLLHITVGSLALERLLEIDPGGPVIATLITKDRYLEITQAQGIDSAHGRVSAIFIEQPLSRQIALLNFIFPKARHMGVLIGRQSFKQLSEVKRLAARHHFEVIVSDGRRKRVIDAIKDLVKTSDFIFALPDNEIMTPSHAKWLLYMGYKRRVPIIGYSKNFVRAGALAALYSTNRQIARQIAQILHDTFKGKGSGNALPPPAYPNDFEVGINQGIARSLGLNLINADSLKQRLRKHSGDVRP